VTIVFSLFFAQIFDEWVFLLWVEEESEIVIGTKLYTGVIQNKVGEVLALIKFDVLLGERGIENLSVVWVENDIVFIETDVNKVLITLDLIDLMII